MKSNKTFFIFPHSREPESQGAIFWGANPGNPWKSENGEQKILGLAFFEAQ
jgi:hypothetical protein